jgi:hypothetical protein
MIKVLIGGDYCPLSRVSELVEGEKFDEIFKEIIPITKNMDYSIVNLECPIVTGKLKPITKYGPNLMASPKAIKAIKYAGFNMVTLANNHFYDYGLDGVKDTLETCFNYGIDTVGGGENLEIAKKIEYNTILGKIVAFINCCEHEFSIATETEGGSNPLNPITIYYQILEARKKADYIIMIIHGGHEHYQLPSPRMKQTYRFFVDAGVDAVINHHQHCYSGFEIYNEKPIFYGIGNLCFDSEIKRNSIWNEGYLVELKLDEDAISFQLYPYIQGNVEAGIVMMNTEKSIIFENNLQRLNTIISQDLLLKKAIEKYSLEEGKRICSIFEPYTNKYLYGLLRRNLFPSLLTKKKLLAIRNIVECESHNDKLLTYLKSIK